MKLEHTTTREGDFFEITDVAGNTVKLDACDALLLLQWLYEKQGEITRLVNNLDNESATGEQM